MAGGPPHLLSAAIAPIGFHSTSKNHMKILSRLSKSTCKYRIWCPNPHQNHLFAPKTQVHVWIRPREKRVLCPPLLMGRTNSVSPAAEKLTKIVAHFLGKLCDVLWDVAALLYRVFADIQWNENTLKRIQWHLKQTEFEQSTVEGVIELLEDISKVSYEVEDIIDELGIFSQTAQRRPESVIARHVERFLSQIRERIIVAWQIFQIEMKIHNILRKDYASSLQELRRLLGLVDKPELVGPQDEVNTLIRKQMFSEAISSTLSLQHSRRSSAMVNGPEVVGLQDEINTLRNQLISEERNRRVISIVGITGSGKTTLAKRVYHDVKDDFDSHAFICLSQQCKIKDVMMLIIEGILGFSKEMTERFNADELGMIVFDHLRKKRYLVVIDDVWSKETWDEMLKPILPDVQNKSRVMLTTRIKTVALNADPFSPPLEMRPLNINESRELFTKKIFPGENPPAAFPSDLEKIGNQILEKCGGLPLAVLTFGSILSRKDKTTDAWSEVSAAKIFKQYSKILALSYWDLPHYLKPCFLYLGLFPKKYEIDSEKLIRLWIAEGLIQQKCDEIIEDIAEEYLEELVDRGMIEASSKRSNGSIAKCRIHDLLHDLAISIAEQINFFTIRNNTSSFSNNVRRVALQCSIDGFHPTATLRSILNFCNSDVSQLELEEAKLLRVVSQTYGPSFSGVTLSRSVREFVHLRYLEVGASKSLLSSIGDLKNLQTLILNPSKSSLPNAIADLVQLRHLEAIGDFVKGNLPINNLTNLQTLCLSAGSWIENGFGKLTNLRKLVITGSTDSYHKALCDSIDALKNLRSLSLQSQSYLPLFMPFTAHLHLYHMSLDGRIQKLPELPPNLAEMTLAHSDIEEQDAISLLEKLPHLKILRLYSNSYNGKKMICSSGGFTQLETLELYELPLEEWIVEEGAMASLKSVTLRGLHNLKTQALPKRVRALLKWI